ncbi:MAG: RodZ domain-containing protein [Methylophilaceae bacterium]
MNDSVNYDLIHTDNIQVAVAPIAPVLGALLQGAREQLGLSIEDISNRLRLSPRQVQAMESDDFSALPEAMITRGFIRNYARLLGLDAEPLLEAYRALVPSSDSPRAISIVSENILISGSNKHPWRMYMLASLAVALLLGAWLIYVDYFPHQSAKLAPATEIAATAKARTATESGTYTELLPMAALPAAERLPEDKATVAAATQPESRAAAVVGASATSRTSNPTPAGTNTLAKLKFTFSDHTWVRVIDRNNKEILNKTKPAGSEETVEGQPPFKVTIGNATGSKLVFNDKPVDLAPYTKFNVVHLTLE